MAIELWKFQLEGYLIRDPRGMDDPNDIDLSDFISLRIKETLTREVKIALEGIEKKFPKRSERYIEIEV